MTPELILGHTHALERADTLRHQGRDVTITPVGRPGRLGAARTTYRLETRPRQNPLTTRSGHAAMT